MLLRDTGPVTLVAGATKSGLTRLSGSRTPEKLGIRRAFCGTGGCRFGRNSHQWHVGAGAGLLDHGYVKLSDAPTAIASLAVAGART